ncbi:helix-turn-helix transcriptional regulator [Streptomyces microflavus]|uniref:helix-turn-helix transcriptional regulator n=1 Tax=Streptomyces microflavus TaxID=1919 RepID=UPI00381B6155
MTRSTTDEAAAPPLPSPKERRRLREAKSLSEEQVAEAVGVTRATVRSWETGRTSPRGRKRALYAKLIAPDPEPVPATRPKAVRRKERPERPAPAAEPVSVAPTPAAVAPAAVAPAAVAPTSAREPVPTGSPEPEPEPAPPRAAPAPRRAGPPPPGRPPPPPPAGPPGPPPPPPPGGAPRPGRAAGRGGPPAAAPPPAGAAPPARGGGPPAPRTGKRSPAPRGGTRCPPALPRRGVRRAVRPLRPRPRTADVSADRPSQSGPGVRRAGVPTGLAPLARGGRGP